MGGSLTKYIILTTPESPTSNHQPYMVNLILLMSIIIDAKVVKGSVWESYKLILNDGRLFPETADVIFFSEKFVF